jgi:hypothetical protein
MTSNAQVNALLLKDKAGLTQQGTKLSQLLTRYGHYVAAGGILDHFFSVWVEVLTFVKPGIASRAAKLGQTGFQPPPDPSAVSLAVGQVPVAPDRDQKGALQQLLPRHEGRLLASVALSILAIVRYRRNGTTGSRTFPSQNVPCFFTL